MAIPMVGALAADETTLVAAARSGDVRARESLYRAHVAALARRARYLVHDAAEAEDLVQEAFAAAFTSLWRFRGESLFATWLHRIALNLARHHWRSKARARSFLRAFSWLRTADEQDQGEAAGGGADVDEDVRLLRRAVEVLSPKLREAFVLLALEELSGEEASRVSGVKVEVWRVRATRARQRLSQVLRAAHGEES
jgi:RNA polymerase sigma-70 factor (ECF subfamily)